MGKTIKEKDTVQSAKSAPPMLLLYIVAIDGH